MAIINGSDLMLFINGKSIAMSTSHKLSITAETAEISHKDVGGAWGASAVKKLSWETSTENLFSSSSTTGNGYDELFNLMIAKTPIDAVFSTTENIVDDMPTGGWTVPTSGCYKGKVIITSLELNAQSGENATFTASFKGTGALSKV